MNDTLIDTQSTNICDLIRTAQSDQVETLAIE